MDVRAPIPCLFRFGVFELDLTQRELRKSGRLIRLAPQPFSVLALLVGRAGQVVAREEIKQEIWADGTFVDFEQGLNHCIRQIRSALADNADVPRYVETLPRRGYRFVMRVEQVARTAPPEAMSMPAAPPAPLPEIDLPAPGQRPAFRSPRRLVFTGCALGLVTIAGLYAWLSRTPEVRLAVLPLQQIGPDKNDEYLSEGLTVEITQRLSRVPGLQVAGSISSSIVKDRDLRQIGKALNVSVVIKGSVRRENQNIRIALQLVKTDDGFQLWSETYDREIHGIFGVQEEVAQTVASTLRVRLLRQGPASTPPSGEAYNAYLEGNYFLDRGDELKAKDKFDQCLRLDPNYARAWERLGEVQYQMAAAAKIPPEQGFARARDSVNRALGLDPNLADGYATLGLIQWQHDWDWHAADRSFGRARELAPEDPSFMRTRASLLRSLGRLDEGITLYSRAIEIDPLVPHGRRNFGLTLHYAGREAEALASIRKALELNPSLGKCHGLIAQILLMQSRPDEALVEAGMEKDRIFGPVALALVQHALGNRAESDRQLALLIGTFQADASYQVAEIFAYRGEIDRAFEWLDRAYQARDSGIPEVKCDPLMASVRSDPRYRELLARLRLS